MNIEEYLNSLPRFPANLGLDNLREALNDLGLLNPPFRCVHIAGTKGKGSTSVMVANILKNASYKTGLFISPHLVDIKERISVDGERISKEAFPDLFRRIKRPLGFFETLLVMSFLYFREKEVEIAVLEAGLGGRLDATNVIEKPLVSILTTIGLDHLENLGETVEKIACEKAGIVKSFSPVISAPQKESVEEIIREKAKSLDSPFYLIGKDYTVLREDSIGSTGERFSVHSCVTGNDYKKLTLNLSGYHQVINASLAIATSEMLNQAGYEISEISIRNGLDSAIIRGRFEIINVDGRVIILDGAHNPDSAEALCKTLSEKFPGKEIIFIFTSLRGKLVKEIISRVSKLSKFFIFTELPSNETYRVEELRNILLEVSLYKESIEIKNPVEAFIYAVENSEKSDIICVTGSLYLVGEIISFLEAARRKWR